MEAGGGGEEEEEKVEGRVVLTGFDPVLFIKHGVGLVCCWAKFVFGFGFGFVVGFI